MKRYISIIILVLFVFCISKNGRCKKDEALTITKTNWEKTKKGVDYTEHFKERNPKKIDNIDFSPYKYDISAFKYVFYFLVVGLIVFLIIKIIINYNKNPNIKTQKIDIDAIEEIEEKMHEIDLEALLKEALEAKKYNIALRINFLIIIKTLSLKGEIEWTKEKTNWEYFSELKTISLKPDFKNIIISFESIWYGEHAITENQYLDLSPQYEKFKTTLNPPAPVLKDE